ncbi:hydrogenase formation protein HypD [Acidiphilium sp.]|uniref:hydrogenase formation protein HypD n=1 Tax=Acidiphilium sp. TaxID=527 RepID=UPI0025901F1E|nr:hydrogenase formation protein HypD [Acidiphilium sp.]
MKYLDEYRDPAAARRLAGAIGALVTRPWTIMEICGGQTHSLLRHGIDQMLPAGVTLLHGPGCPVCVTAAEVIDQAITLAAMPGVILCSFGDMLRVPGMAGSLLGAKARGADVRMVYSPLDAVALAKANPNREVVFLAVGFETTAPATAIAVLQAEAANLVNFSLICAHVMVPPAIAALLAAPDNPVQGFLAAGHVCTVMGDGEYLAIARRFGVPIVVTGFEPVDLLLGILACLGQLETGRAEVENRYARAVRDGGNPVAQAALRRVFVSVPRAWRGMGEIAASGLDLAPRYARFDARLRFHPEEAAPGSASPCISGEILRGRAKPTACPAFATSCTPEHPLGATMVSTEGACAAYYRYRRTAA